MAANKLLLPCISPDPERDRRKRSREIDRQLAREKKVYIGTYTILLFGSDEEGKSTFVKQMRIINGGGFDDQELKTYRLVVYENIVRGMKVLIDARNKLGIPFEREEESLRLADFVFGFDNNIKLEEPVFLQYVPAIARLWTDAGIQTAFDRRHEYQLNDSVKYFFDNLDRIGQLNYIPIDEDILHSQEATRHFTEHRFMIHNRPFLFVDVGFRLTHRQKWFQYFEDITSIIFLVSSDEFDQVLYEDRKTNRLVESCNTFEAIVNSKTFAEVHPILLFNKIDLLEEKIKYVNIKHYFPQFYGDPHRLSDVQRFEVSMFEERMTVGTRTLFHHFTVAVDMECMNFISQSVLNIIMRKHLKMLEKL